MSFRVTLSSNVDSRASIGKINKIGEFTTKLGRTISLEGDWSVGLTEIFYTKSWFNVLNSHKIALFDELGENYIQTNEVNTDRFTIQNGFYETPQKLIAEINQILHLFTDIKPPTLTYNEINNYVTIEAGKIEGTIKVYPSLGEEIENILGLRNRDINKNLYTNSPEGDFADYIFRGDDIYRGDSMKAFHPVEISGGFHSLYVYSDIVYPSLVGDSFSQLLRIVEVPRKHKFTDTVHLLYENPQYIPLMLNKFETIEISIRDDTDKLVPFKSGRCIVVLEFKRL